MKDLKRLIKKCGKDAKVEMTLNDLYDFANYIIKELDKGGNEGGPKLLTLKETSKRIKKSESTIYRWMKLEIITPFYVGGHLYFKEEDVKAFTNGYRLVG